MRHDAYSAVQQGLREKEKKWAVSKFFLCLFFNYSNWFFTRRLRDITHIEPYDREKKGGDDENSLLSYSSMLF